jgi:DNA primase
MAIAEDDIEKVRTATSIVDVIQPYVALRRVGRNWVGLCPFHAEKSGSFNVREQTQRYRCFGCGASGDAFKFIQDMEHVDFVTSVERLAAKVGIVLTYSTSGESKERGRRKQLIEAMEQVVDWYHQRLLTAPDARTARDYLRNRGLSGEVARQFRIGWAPDDWDSLARGVNLPEDVLTTLGLAFHNRRNKLQDAFRARVLFPIFTADGEAVAIGGRILPGSADPAKYKNSSETPLYSKSKVLYGLNWAKAEAVSSNQVIVCEGYTDVIGFHRAGLRRAVATCGTAFTEEHVKLLKRYASRVVLAFDADAAGQGAAEKFYEWEEKYQVEVSVAHFPQGKDPADMATNDPEGLRRAVEQAEPFLGFRVQRVLGSRPAQSPEQRARAAEAAMSVISEHPNATVRGLYAGEVAARLSLPVADLVSVAQRGGRRPVVVNVPVDRRRTGETKEFVAIALLVQRWDEIAPSLVDGLFAEDAAMRAFRSLAEAGGDIEAAITASDPEARDLLERAAVVDVDEIDVDAEVRNLLNAAVRRELALRLRVADPDEIREDAEARRLLEQLDNPVAGQDAVDRLLVWLHRRVHDGAPEQGNDSVG